MTVWVGLVTCELHVPGARSLKEKRRAVKSFVDRAHKRHRVSVAETGLHDVHQRAEIGLAVVSGSQRGVEKLLDSLRALTDELHDAMVARWDERIGHEDDLLFDRGDDR